MKTYEIGDAIVLLDEIAAIEKLEPYISDVVYVPILFKNGVKIKATINAIGNELAESQSDPHTKEFLMRFKKEYADFIKAWQDYILENR